MAQSKFNFGFTLLAFLALAGSARAEVLSPELAEIKKSFYQESFQSFVHDLRAQNKSLNLGSDEIPPPPYDPALSRNQWIDTYSDWVASHEGLSASDTKKLRDQSEESFYSYYHDEPFARVPFIEKSTEPVSVDTKPAKVEGLKILKAFPENHTLDVPAYVNERFPKDIQQLIISRHIPLYADDSDFKDATHFQAKEGFTEVYRFEGTRDNSESSYLLVRNPKTDAYRFVVTDLVGVDDADRIAKIMGPTFTQSAGGSFIVHHENPNPLFDFNQAGKDLKLTPKDRVVVGFQNTIWWNLFTSPEGKDWDRIPLTDHGTDAALYVNRKTGQRIVNVWNVYGDEMTKTLEAFYQKGGRRFAYLGTAGGLGTKLKIGDVLIPNQFQQRDGSWITMSNDASRADLKIPPQAVTYQSARQGWVSTLIDESRPNMIAMRDEQKADGLDIEAGYFAKFFQDHPATEKSVVLVVSDNPLGSATYDKENLNRAQTTKTVKSLLNSFMNYYPNTTPEAQAEVHCQAPPSLFNFNVELTAFRKLITNWDERILR
jgi:hypothetical protein